MKKIKLTRGEYAIVDEEDFEWLNRDKWYCQVSSGIKYAARRDRFEIVYMHRLILGTPEDKFTDHINQNGLDNRRDNLRVVDAVTNGYNRRISVNNKSGMTGVSWNSQLKKWKVNIQVSKKRLHFGYFKDKFQAIKVCKKARKEHFGEFA